MKKQASIIIFLWLSIIGVFVLTQQIILLSGKEVLLKTVPIDPRDLFRGDYVILNYEIAQIPKTGFAYNSTVYVSLNTDDNNIAHIKNISYKKPSDELYLKGKVTGCPTIVPGFRTSKCVSYGIESYFVKEGEGKTIEKNLRDGALVRVAIDKRGYAKIKRLF